MKKELIKAYLAGLMDGEGTITLTRSHKFNEFKYPIVSMSSTSIELINIFIEYYGGTVSRQKKYEEHHKQSYSWKLQSNRTLVLLNDILPYMLEPAKLYRGNILLGYYKSVTSPNGKYTEQMRLAKYDFEDAFFHPSYSIDKSLAAL